MSLPTSANLSLSQINSCMRFTNGNVGIGTTAPTYKLDLSGPINATNFYQNGVVFSGGGGGGIGFSNTLSIGQTTGTTITSGTPIVTNYFDQNTAVYNVFLPSNMTSGNNFTITNTGSTRSSFANIYSNVYVRMGSSTTSGSLARLNKGDTLRVVATINNPTLPSHFQEIITRRPTSGGNKWVEQSITNQRNWYGVCWSPELGLFCSVSFSGAAVVMTSPDGITWTERAIPNMRSFLGICWSPELGLFCSTSEASIAITSPDGITWTERSMPLGARRVCWSPELGLFCAVRYGGSAFVVTSPDGITWTSRSISTAANWTSICWSPQLGLFCAVCDNSAIVMTSPDGITWTNRSITNGRNYMSICWSPELGLFCAINSNTVAAIVMTSPDGITWTERSVSAARNWYGVTWAPELSLFCAVANSNGDAFVMTSRNGITWTERATPAGRLWDTICWSPELMTFCASGATTSVLTSTF